MPKTTDIPDTTPATPAKPSARWQSNRYSTSLSLAKGFIRATISYVNEGTQSKPGPSGYRWHCQGFSSKNLYSSEDAAKLAVETFIRVKLQVANHEARNV